MKKLATSIFLGLALGLGLSINVSSIAADSNPDKTAAPKATTPAGAAMPPADVTTNAPGKVVETKKEKKHDRKLAKKSKKNQANVDGDGAPMGKIGSKKDVDGGFDFDNSKKFHRMGNTTP